MLSALPPDEPVLAQGDMRGRLVSVVVVVDAHGAVVERFQHLAVET